MDEVLDDPDIPNTMRVTTNLTEQQNSNYYLMPLGTGLPAYAREIRAFASFSTRVPFDGSWMRRSTESWDGAGPRVLFLPPFAEAPASAGLSLTVTTVVWWNPLAESSGATRDVCTTALTLASRAHEGVGQEREEEERERERVWERTCGKGRDATAERCCAT